MSEKLSQNKAAPYVVKKLPVGKKGIQKTKITKREDKFTVSLVAR